MREFMQAAHLRLSREGLAALTVAFLTLILALLLSFLLARPAAAQDASAHTVTVGDGTAVSCSDAALAAAIAAGGSISFDCGPAPVTIVATQRYLVNKAVAIDGGGFVTLSGGNATGVLNVVSGGDLTLKNITLTGAVNYAAVTTSGLLTVDNVTFDGSDRPGIQTFAFSNETAEVVTHITNSRFQNQKRVGLNVGGGTVTVESSQFTANNVGGSSWGGAIDAQGVALLSVRNSTFSGNEANEGGAIYIGADVQATISDSTFTGNVSRGGGGAISSGGTTTLQRVTIAGNVAPGGGGIQNRGDLTVKDSYIHDNQATSSFGGGISHFNRTTEPGSLTLSGVTLAGNWGQQAGGGVAFMTGETGPFSAENVTFSDNAAQKGGGFFMDSGVATIRHATFYSNTATVAIHADQVQNQGTLPEDQGALEVHNTIYVNGDCVGPAGGGGNLQSPGTACGAQVTADPQLSPLQQAGGFAPLHIFPQGSPAQNTATLAECADWDQRGVTRPQHGGCDVGAFEWGAQPGLNKVTPDKVGVGSGAFTLSAEGVNFLGGPNGSRIRWNGTPLPTTWISPTLLSAQVPADHVAAPGTAFITVETPVAGVPDGGVAPGQRTVDILRMVWLPAVTKQN